MGASAILESRKERKGNLMEPIKNEIRNLSDEELEKIDIFVKGELKQRKQDKQAQANKKVVDAMLEFFNLGGVICVGDEVVAYNFLDIEPANQSNLIVIKTL